MQIGSLSLRELVLAERVEVRYLVELGSFYIRAIRGGGEYVMREKNARPMLFDNEAAAWKVVRKYRDIDTPGLVD